MAALFLRLCRTVPVVSLVLFISSIAQAFVRF